jgi:hypothetical protein
VKRIIQRELLDTLPFDAPRAVRSRRDLQRVNGWMRHPALMADALRNNWNGLAPRQITELGAGDGDFLLRVAQRLGSFGVPAWAGPGRLNAELPTEIVNVTLLDLQKNVSAETLAGFGKLGWRAETVMADVFDWPQNSNAGDVVIANLFLHHFGDARLAELLRLISQRAKLFIALEPRRAPWPLVCSRLLWAIGCNDVTRHDAVVSVRAGFSGGELSALWPEQQHWRLTERRAGIFSHLFIAQKMS